MDANTPKISLPVKMFADFVNDYVDRITKHVHYQHSTKTFYLNCRNPLYPTISDVTLHRSSNSVVVTRKGFCEDDDESSLWIPVFHVKQFVVKHLEGAGLWDGSTLFTAREDSDNLARAVNHNEVTAVKMESGSVVIAFATADEDLTGDFRRPLNKVLRSPEFREIAELIEWNGGVSAS